MLRKFAFQIEILTKYVLDVVVVVCATIFKTKVFPDVMKIGHIGLTHPVYHNSHVKTIVRMCLNSEKNLLGC